jgi:hypothetical protein
MAPTDRPPARLPDPLRSRAVLVGPRDYRNLAALPAVPRNLERLRALLTDPVLWGLPDSNCVVLDDPRSTDEVLNALRDAAGTATDGLLFYFAGHGLLDNDAFRLWLALADAGIEPVHDAVRYEDVRRNIRHSSCPIKIVILDCCYSGQALEGAMAGSASGAAALADRARIEGSYILTACTEDDLAIAPRGAAYTAFSQKLFDVIDHGVPGAGELLDSETVYWHVRNDLEAADFPAPQQRVHNDGALIALVRNRAHVVPAAPPGEALSRGADPAVHPAGAAPAAAPAPPGPRLPVTALLARIAAGDVAADDLFGAEGAEREPQEIAHLIRSLDEPGADRVLRAVAGRSPPEIAALFQVLRKLGWDWEERQLRGVLAGQDAALVTAVVQLLDSATGTALLHAVADRYAGRPEMIIRLVGELSTAGRSMATAVDDLLTRLARSLSPDDAAVIADALRSADQQAAAFRLYRTAQPAILGRPPDELVALAAAMYAAGNRDQALDLIEKTAPACTTTERADTFYRAVSNSGLPAEVIEDAIAVVSTVPPDGVLLELARRMIDRGQGRDAEMLIREAAARRGIDSVIRFVHALFDVGRPVDAMELARDNVNRSAQDVLVLLVDFLDRDPAGLARNLLKAVTAEGTRLDRIAPVIVAAGDPSDGLLRYVAAHVSSHGPAGVLDVALALIRADRRPVARRLLAACAAPLTARLSDRVCDSYTRLTSRPRSSGRGMTGDSRAVPRPHRRRSLAPDADPRPDRPAASRPPRRIRVPDRLPTGLWPEPASPALHTVEGIRVRAALVVDLLAALPAKIDDLAWMTDGGTPGAPERLAEAVLASPGVRRSVLALILEGGPDDYVVAAAEHIGAAADAPQWSPELWAVIRSRPTGPRFPSIVASRCSCRAITAMLAGLTHEDAADDDFIERVLSEVRQHSSEPRRIAVADRLAAVDRSLAARLLGTGGLAPLDAATQAGLAAAGRAFALRLPGRGDRQRPGELHLGSTVLSYDAAGVRVRQESLFRRSEALLAWSRLAGLHASWRGGVLELRSPRSLFEMHPMRFVIGGRVDQAAGRAVADALTTVGDYIERVLNLPFDTPVPATADEGF